MTSFIRPWSKVHAVDFAEEDARIFLCPEFQEVGRILLTSADVCCDLWYFYPDLCTCHREEDCTGAHSNPCGIYLMPEAKSKSALLAPIIVCLQSVCPRTVLGAEIVIVEA